MTTGLRWLRTSLADGGAGRELTHKKLATALRSKTEFSAKEWEALGVKELGATDFVRLGASYYRPVTVTHVQSNYLRELAVILTQEWYVARLT